MQSFYASLHTDHRRIMLGCGGAKMAEFYRSLPNARCIGIGWLCDFTPAAAWRIMYESPGDPIACKAIKEAAERFATRGGADPPNPTQTALWPHQTAALRFAANREAVMLAMRMGTGKSAVAIGLTVLWLAQKVLVLCPLSVCRVWEREWRTHLDPQAACMRVLDRGSPKRKRDNAIEALAYRGPAPGRQRQAVVVVNYESAWREPFGSWSLSKDWDCVILDESHRIKAHNSTVSRYAAQLADHSRRRLCLSGTPLAHSPLDLFGQYRFLDRGLLGTSWTRFSSRYALHENPCMPQQVTGYQNQAELSRLFAMLAFQCGDEVLAGLPGVNHHERYCRLSAGAQRVYRELEADFCADIGNGTVTAANVLVRLLRLQQATSGYAVEDQTGRIDRLCDAKAAALSDLLDDIGPEPVVVFCRFREDLAEVGRAAEKARRTYGEISGQCKNGLAADATIAHGVQVLGVQMAAGSLGIDLTAARYAVYYSLGFSLAEYEQSLARLHRPGQTRPVHYYHLVVPGTVDERVYRALRERKDVVDAVMKGYSE